MAELKKAEGEQVQFVLPKITLEAPVLVKPAYVEEGGRSLCCWGAWN